MTEREINEQIVLRLGMIDSIRQGQSSFMCHCPFHVDRHPSCSVNLDKNVYKCFSCGSGGTLRQLFRSITNHSINKELGIPWEGQDKEDFVNPFLITPKEDPRKQPDVHIALDGAFIPVNKNSDCTKYLQKRCIPIQVAYSMKMQFAPMAKSYDTTDPTNKDKWVYFTNRLVIPVFEKGKLMTCEGRDIYGEEYFFNQLKRNGKNPEDFDYKKCIYPKCSSTSTLFDIDKLDKSEMIFFMEGIMDLAVLRADSYFTNRNSTSVFGASLSSRQMALLADFKSTNCLLDNDYAGWLSLQRWAKYLKDNNIKGDHYYTLPPYSTKCKDIGDVPVKMKKTIQECREAKWLTTSRPVLLDIKLIETTVEELREKQLKENKK